MILKKALQLVSLKEGCIVSDKNTKKRISEKQWRILEYFIIEESKKIEIYLGNKKRNNKEEISHFKTYPGKIERTIEEMTRVTAIKACELFADMGILEKLEKEPGEHLKGGDITPYSLSSKIKSFRILIKLILEGSFKKIYLDKSLSYPEAMDLLDNYYFTYNINDSLIREVLAEKGVTITRFFSPMDFDLKSAQRLIDLDEKNYGISEGKKDVTEIIESMVNRFEEEAKKTERSHINNLTEFCNGFLEMVNDSTNSIESGLQNYENLAVRLIERFDDSRSYVSPSFGSPLEDVKLQLPVFCDGMSNIEKINRIKEDNFHTFYYLLYGDNAISFSKVLRTVLSYNEQILEKLREIESFLRLSNDYLSDNYSAEMNEFEDKWKSQIDINKDEYNPNYSAKLLEDLKAMYSNLPDSLEKLMEEYNRDYDLESMIRNIDNCYNIMEKEVLKHSGIKNLNNEFINNNFDTILTEHYQKFEYEKIIVPVLSLIHTSPLALNELLNGEWDCFNLSILDRDKLENSDFLTKLIHIAVINLLVYPKILKKGIVQCAGMEHAKYPDHSQIMSTYKPNLTIQNFREFEHTLFKDWYDNMDFTEFKSIEPTFLQIKLKQFYEIRYKLSFLAEYKSESNTTVYSKAELKINSELEVLKVSHIKDPVAMILKLKSDNSKFAYIRNMFSTQMQNKVLFINDAVRPSMSFVKELFGELNNVIMNPDFYEDGIFDDVLPKKEGNRSVLKSHLNQQLANSEIVQMVNEDPLYHRWFLGDNRYLLEKSFENEIESGYPEHFEKYLDRRAEKNNRKSKIKNKSIY